MNTNPLNHNSAMLWKDACIVALILTLATYFTVFLSTWNYLQIRAELVDFVYASVQFFGAGFLTQFIALAGLHKVTEKKNHSEK